MNYLLSLPGLPELETTEPVKSDLDVEPYTTSEGYLFVPVAVGELTGWYNVQQHKVICRGQCLSPTGFECLGGKENNRKWRVSIRVLLPDGTRGVTLGQWLTTHGLEHMIPSPKTRGNTPTSDSLGLEPSPYPGGSNRSNSSSPQKRNRGGSYSLTATPGAANMMMQNAPHYESPTKQRRTDSVEGSGGTQTITAGTTPGHATDANRAELIAAFLQQRLALASPVAPALGITPGITAPPTTPVFLDIEPSVKAAAIATAILAPRGPHGHYATSTVLSSRVLALPRPAISPQKVGNPPPAVEIPGNTGERRKLERSEASSDLVNAFEGMEAALESPDGVEAYNQILFLNNGAAQGAQGSQDATSPQYGWRWENKPLRTVKSEPISPTGEWEQQVQMPGAAPKAAATNAATAKAAASAAATGVSPPTAGRSPPSPPPEMLSNWSPAATLAAEDARNGPTYNAGYIITTRFEAVPVPHHDGGVEDTGGHPTGFVPCDSSGDNSTNSCQETANPPAPPRAQGSFTDVSK